MGGADFDRGCREYLRLRRREVLAAGVLGSTGLTLAGLLEAEAAQTRPHREMSCILVWLRGGPSSIDMWDLKPEAPSEIRGPFRPLKTNVPGIEISEHLPLCARIADKFCLVRSVTHPREDHEGGSHVNSTGWNTWPAQAFPMFGTVVQKLQGYHGSLPPHVHLPEPPQPYSGGKHHLSLQELPFVISAMNDLDLKVRDVSLPTGVDSDRLARRRRLLEAGGRSTAPLAGADDRLRTSSVFSDRALDLLTSPATRDAFDLTREPARLRDRYGRGALAAQVVAQGDAGDIAPNEFSRSIVGQGLLMARRLVEAGTRFVTVVGRGWDTHADNFNRLKDQLLPPLDHALYGLLTDLDERGMLGSTLVVVTGDFNRTPKINRDAGRDHWGHVQTLFLAGGGVPGGTVLGASDPHCAYPSERPIPAQDIAATLYHKFGIAPDTQIAAFDGRPFPVLPDEARPVKELL